MTSLKKVFGFLGSMKFALILLGILTCACAGGSFITQGKSYEWYVAAYGERPAAGIMLLGLDDVFHSWYFVAITLFLCLNLLLCSVVRFPSVMKRFREGFLPERLSEKDKASGVEIKADRGRVCTLMAKLGFHHPAPFSCPEGEGLYGARNRMGVWGAWLTHIGILIVIAGFGFGQMMKVEYTVYGVPGQTRPIGDTSYLLSIDDFQVGLREDDTVEQYTTSITVRDASRGAQESGQVSVNHPMSMFGMKFFQNSTGWAAKISVEKNGETIQEEVVCAGDYLEVEDKPGLIILFSSFYPDYVWDAEAGPMSAGSALNNPGYLYRAYYMDQVIGMNVLTGDDVITIDEYTVIFSDPQMYSLIQVKRDPFTGLALIGGLVVMLALILALYVQPQEIWAVPAGDGLYRIGWRSRKGGALFDDRVRNTLVDGTGV